MPKCHLRAIEVKEIHQLYRSTLLQRPIINAPRFVIHLDIDGEYFGEF